MDNKNVVIDINSITKTKQLMDSECDKLISMLNKYKSMFEETKTIYDTDSATIYRKIATTYLDYILSYINSDLKPYTAKLDDIKKTYAEEITVITREIQGGAE